MLCLLITTSLYYFLFINSISRRNLDINTAIPDRGTKFLQQLYRENLEPIFSSWGSYGPDFMWMERAVIYGLFLSDHEVLSAVEAELVTLASIMSQGLSGPTIWHLRGLRRLGVSEDDVESVQKAIEAVATWAGKSVEGWPRVTDVPDVIQSLARSTSDTNMKRDLID